MNIDTYRSVLLAYLAESHFHPPGDIPAEFVQVNRAKSGIVRPIFFRLQRSRSNSLSEGQVVFFPFGYPNETKRSCREHGRARC